jgi:hypothetical protein
MTTAEREAKFNDLTQRVHKRIREVAILVFAGGLITSLRECWSSEQITAIGSACVEL